MSTASLNDLNARLNALLAHVPSVERVLSSAPLEPLIAAYGRTRVLDTIRAALDAWRREAQAGAPAGRRSEPPDEALIAAVVARRLAADDGSRPRPVFTLTGTLLH